MAIVLIAVVCAFAYMSVHAPTDIETTISISGSGCSWKPTAWHNCFKGSFSKRGSGQDGEKAKSVCTGPIIDELFDLASGEDDKLHLARVGLVP